MLGLIVTVGILALVGGIIFAIVCYFMGREDAAFRYKYNNKFSGVAAQLYDFGYDSVEADRNRAKANLEAHTKRREARG